MIYRTLRALEGEGCIESRWDVHDAGQPKRFYFITVKGWERLEDYFKDIKMRMDNFQFFFEAYQTLLQNTDSADE
ncbi:transcriptional regulator PadR-like family protein [Desulfosporosinus acididurans]|uniref:Transcriptional regulator PadR-like family protein n=2 Tax=Desulfosporosinus TaxID=79206 RepID=A0A0J1IJJ8_9FIRM|nr:PadR family transcriptional regulator [Desulfosporosinus acididurans]KLU64901.1 transcriptional regulator PadR-like family protein [Desulfosporosinus acididurans]